MYNFGAYILRHHFSLSTTSFKLKTKKLVLNLLDNQKKSDNVFSMHFRWKKKAYRCMVKHLAEK